VTEEGTTLLRLTELLRQARKVDPQLGADLEAEFVALTNTKPRVREAIRLAQSTKALYESEVASDY